MRIADKMNYEQVTNNLGRNRAEMSDLQNQAALQKRVTKPSDDPLGATRILGMRTEVNGNNQYLKSISNAKAFLEYSEESLGALSDALVRAKELAINQANDASAGPKSRELVASEVTQLHSQAVQIGNRKLGDRFLFGGFRTQSAPFDPDGNYHGDNGLMEVIIDKEAKLAMNIPGNLAFLGRGLRSPATGNPDPQSLESLPQTEPHIRSVHERRASSTPDYELPPEIAPGLTPGSTLGLTTMRAPASEKSEATHAPDQLTRKQAELERKLSERGIDVFSVLKGFEVALKTNDKPGIQESIDKLDTAIEQVVLARAELGSRVGTLTATADSLAKGTVDAKTMSSNIEDADTFQLVSDINKAESTLKATLATSGKLIQPSLLDFIR